VKREDLSGSDGFFYSILQLKTLNKKKAGSGLEICETSLQDSKAFTSENPGFGGKRAYVYGCEPSYGLCHVLLSSIDIA